MHKDRSDSPPPHSQGPRYGVDALAFPAVAHHAAGQAARLGAGTGPGRPEGLCPGGQLLIADPWPMARKYAAHIGQGTLRGLGPEYWYGGPWLSVTLLQAVKEP